ncbi:MAG: PAS domain-containing protein [Alphaproteobacteria bacterium]|nr:PAS domain-containing protein [Alphaproteobacteria bacterium]
MKRFADATIRSKIIAIIMLTTTISLAIAIGVISWNHSATLGRAAVQQGAALAQVLAANTAAAVSFADERAAEQTLATLAEQPSIREAMVILPDGSSLARWVSPQGGLPVDAEAAERWRWTAIASRRTDTIVSRGDARIDVLAPVRLDGERIAYVHLVEDPDALSRELRASLLLGAFGTALALAFAAVLSSVLQHGITARVIGLADAMTAVRKTNDYRIRLTEDARDEIGTLIGSFNRMLAEIAIRDDQLASHRQELARQVADRTADLATTNETLARSNAELVASQQEVQRLALVAKNTDSLVLISDREGRVEWVNPAFERTTGFTLEELRGRGPMGFLAGPETSPETMDTMRQAFILGLPFKIEILAYAKDRRPFWAAVDSVPVRGGDGSVERVVTVASVITERKEHEHRLAQALERERDVVAQQKRFISVAAHEFRTPLTIIDGAAQRLHRYAQRITPADLRERAEKIRQAVARMAQLVDTTLNSARLDAGHVELNLAPLDLVALIDSICRRLDGMAREFDIRIAGGERPHVIAGDSRLLDQAFTNLLSNAVKYSGDSRRIDIAIEVDGAAVNVRIRDYGIGVPAKELPRLFTRFYRASTAKGLPGTGIGLNLVKELVQLHGGTIAVRSTVGEGSEFTVRLPTNPVQSGAAATSAA